MTGTINMLNNNYTELIAKKLSGDLNKTEEETLNTWLNASDENQETFRIYSSIWSETKLKRVSKNADNVFVGISAAIQEEEIDSYKTYQIQEKTRSFSYVWRGIAASVIILVIAVFVFRNTENKEELPVVQSIQLIEKSLPVGQKMKIFLPDGSTVWLNSESYISYPERFDDVNRIVTLTGEAFFDITKDPLKPFIVKTENMNVTVLGTTFNVRNYHNEEITNVALESGNVLVETSGSNENKYILSPGEGICLNEKTGKISKYEVDPKSDFQWREGVIYFRKADFDDVINKLSRWYGVEFIVENYTGEEWVYSAEFKNDYLNNILQSMSFTKDFKYELDQNKVTIKFN